LLHAIKHTTAVALFCAEGQEHLDRICCIAQKDAEDNKDEDAFIIQIRCHKNSEKKKKQ
jgi:hypothetical protein